LAHLEPKTINGIAMKKALLVDEEIGKRFCTTGCALIRIACSFFGLNIEMSIFPHDKLTYC
jgi:hypothetical protein